MYQKTVTLLLAVLLVLSLSGCGSNTAQSTNATALTNPTAPATASTQTAPSEEPEGFAETVVMDDAQCSFALSGLGSDSLWGYTLMARMENKTDKELMFSLDNVSINGFMCDPFWATTVAAGMRSNTAISWLPSELEKNGITAVESIALPVRVYNEDDWTADDILSETFTLTP